MKDNKKINQTRRNRGYVFEKAIVKKFQDGEHWSAVRLGSPSTEIPDVFAVNDHQNKICAIEAKSGTGSRLYIPQDQIERCIRWVQMFGRYAKIVILAFKFKAETDGRELRYFYKIFPLDETPRQLSCDFDGVVRGVGYDNLMVFELEDFKW